MLETVHTIFMAKNLAIAIATYFNLVESVDKKSKQKQYRQGYRNF